MEDQLDKYLNETTAEDISTDDLLNWFENNQSNSNNQFNNTETVGFNNQNEGQKNLHPYESPSSTTNFMEQRGEYDTHNVQHFRGNTAGQYHTIHDNREFKITPNSTQNLVQAATPIPKQNFIQTLVHIKSWEQIKLPGQIDPKLMKMNNTVPLNCNANLLSVHPTTNNYEQTQWQNKQSLVPPKTYQNAQEDLGNKTIPIIIDNQQPVKINENIVTQIKNQASGVRQIVKLRNTDPEPEVNPNPEPEALASTSASPLLEQCPLAPLNITHKQEIKTHVAKTSSRKSKSQKSKSSITKDTTATIISPHKRSTRNITTSKFAKLRGILEKLEDQEFSPSSPTSKAKKTNRTLQDFQVEVAAIIKNDVSRIISRYHIHKKTSPKTQ